MHECKIRPVAEPVNHTGSRQVTNTFNYHTIMERYNYYDAVREDIINYLKENDFKASEYDNAEDAYEKLYDDLWVEDSVTGNASGSYWCNAWKAEECICHNLDLLGEAFDEFGCSGDILKDGAESCDVTIRCYLLSQILSEVLEDYEGEYADDIEEEEEEESEED